MYIYKYECTSFVIRAFYTEATLGFANTSKNTTKKQFYKVKYENTKMSLEFLKLCYVCGSNLRPPEL